MQIKKTILFLCGIYLTSVHSIVHHQEKYYTVILDPAGDAQHVGRSIGDSFERGLTLQCAEKIKEIVESRAPHIKIVLTRMAGDTVYEWQNASLANRIGDFFVNLNFYYTQETKPTIYLYQFSYGNDFVNQHHHWSAVYTYDQAYMVSKHTTDVCSQLFKKELLSSAWQSLFCVTGPSALPIKSLIGITIPSISIEAGLKDKHLWHHYSEPIACAIIAVIDGLGNE